MQNRDSRAMQIKLDELLRAVRGARTELVDLENVTEAELGRYCDEFKVLHLRYAKLLEKRKGKIRVEADSAELETEVARKKGKGSREGAKSAKKPQA
jgi:low affinity Fe/Cu permease